MTRSIDLSNIMQQKTELKQYPGTADESVYAPAFILGEKDPEWDSFLDDTKVNVSVLYS